MFGFASDTNTFISRPAADTIAFFHGGSEKVRIDSSGRLLLGTTTLGYEEGDDLNIATSTHTGITIRSGTSSIGNIYFADGTSGDSQYRGIVQYHHSGDSMRLYTAATERLRIASNGNVAIGGDTNTVPRNLWLYNGSNDPYFRIQRGTTSDINLGGIEFASSKFSSNLIKFFF